MKKAWSSSKGVFDKGWKALDKYAGEPMNRAAGKLGIESVWPTTMDRELDKAARILRTFTLDGGIATATNNVHDDNAAKKTQKVIKRIPPQAIANAKGLAIFTVFRTGFGLSGASGSGVVIARGEDGKWGPPSGLLVHTIGFGFLIGVDVYDVVLILRTESAVKSFARPKVNLGGELALVAGPMGAGAMLDGGYQQAPCWSYTKSKGFYAGVQLDGSIIIERGDENERFYGARYSAAQILEGRVHIPRDAQGLLDTIAAAESRKVADEQVAKGETDRKTDEIPPANALEPHQPESGFGAPPTYDDLEDKVAVKCSTCGQAMDMDALAAHTCGSPATGDSRAGASTSVADTPVREAPKSASKRPVPARPVPPLPVEAPEVRTEKSPEAVGPASGESGQPAEMKNLAGAVEEIPELVPNAHVHSDETVQAGKAIEELRIEDGDDADIQAGEHKIEMVVEDDALVETKK
ncbi:hypothetical protein PYCC9005_002287 [Savitreella phatthalungensis]